MLAFEPRLPERPSYGGRRYDILHDLNGNLTRQTERGTSNIIHYVYDEENRLACVHKGQQVPNPSCNEEGINPLDGRREEGPVMVLERRGRVIAADLGQLVRREEPFVQWKAAAFARWHEPDDARACPPGLTACDRAAELKDTPHWDEGHAMRNRHSRELTLEEAREIAAQLGRQQEQRAEQADPDAWDNAVAAYYRHLSASDVVRLWEAATNEDGKPLSRFELAALIEEWCSVFGELPPIDAAGQSAPAAQPAESEPQLDDLDMMPRADVARRLRARRGEWLPKASASISRGDRGVRGFDPQDSRPRNLK